MFDTSLCFFWLIYDSYYLSSYVGMHVIKSYRIYPNQCFCRSVQTETYNVVNGSYIPKTETKDENEAKVCGSVVSSVLVGELCRCTS